MKNLERETFTLPNFEGPLEFLQHLIQKNEIDIYDISIQQITAQYLEKLRELLEPSIDSGGEFIGTASSLVHLKTRMLLPKHEQDPLGLEEEVDPHFEIIHQLMDYCRFKEAAKELSQREMLQNGYYVRGDNASDLKKPLGIEHLSLEDLASLFKEVIAKTSSQKGLIQEEEWRVSDKIGWVRQLLKEGEIEFSAIFSSDRSRQELIVTFLAVLELMKLGELRIIREVSSGKINLISGSR